MRNTDQEDRIIKEKEVAKNHSCKRYKTSKKVKTCLDKKMNED